MAKAQLKGIGGWLLVYVIFEAYGILTALYNLVSTLTGKTEQQLQALREFGITVNTFPLPVEVGIALVGIGLSIASFTLILMKSKAGILWTQISLWIRFVLGVVSIGYALPSFAFILVPLMVVVMGGITLAWSLYFVKSRRVKNTLVG